MSYIYAMSDIHGCLLAFEKALSYVDLSGDNRLILLGDYIHEGSQSYEVLNRIMELEQLYGCEKVIVLAGNHEDMAVDGRWPISEERFSGVAGYEENDEKYLKWMKTLRRYYKTEHQIFVHAGIDEEADDLWELITDYHAFTEKYPAERGRFMMDIVAGHVGTAEISRNPYFHDIYYDGKSHYYVDGTVTKSGVIPVLKVDVKNTKYYCVAESGIWPILPYDEEN